MAAFECLLRFCRTWNQDPDSRNVSHPTRASKPPRHPNTSLRRSATTAVALAPSPSWSRMQLKSAITMGYVDRLTWLCKAILALLRETPLYSLPLSLSLVPSYGFWVREMEVVDHDAFMCMQARREDRTRPLLPLYKPTCVSNYQICISNYTFCPLNPPPIPQLRLYAPKSKKKSRSYTPVLYESRSTISGSDILPASVALAHTVLTSSNSARLSRTQVSILASALTGSPRHACRKFWTWAGVTVQG